MQDHSDFSPNPLKIIWKSIKSITTFCTVHFKSMKFLTKSFRNVLGKPPGLVVKVSARETEVEIGEGEDEFT